MPGRNDRGGEHIAEQLWQDILGKVLVEFADIRHAPAEDDDIGIDDIDNAGQAPAEAIEKTPVASLRRLISLAHCLDDGFRCQLPAGRFGVLPRKTGTGNPGFQAAGAATVTGWTLPPAMQLDSVR